MNMKMRMKLQNPRKYEMPRRPMNARVAARHIINKFVHTLLAKTHRPSKLMMMMKEAEDEEYK